MKKKLIVLLTFFSLAASAQKNELLDQAFWQAKPGVTAVKAAIAKGNNPSELNANSMDPVVMAINSQAPYETIEYLLTQPGNNVNKLTHDGRIYLHWAANRGNDQLVKYLLDKGSKIDVEDSHGSVPVLFAAGGAQPNTKVYDLFIAHGVDLKKTVNQDGANALLLAIANDKDLVLTNYFLSKGLSLNSTDAAGNNAFSYAARAGNLDLLKILLAKGAKPTPGAMLMAAQGGGGRRGAVAPSGTALAFYQALEGLGLSATVKAKNGENILHALVKKQNQHEVIQYFLTKGIDVNELDEDGNTVLMDATAVNRDTALIALLLPKIKNINQANQTGMTALTYAVRNNSPEMIAYLINKGASVNAIDKKGNNLAYYVIDAYRPQAGPAAAKDLEAKLSLLKKHGLDIGAPQQDGNTLYHLAIAKNNIDLFKNLQSLNIDINAKNKEGMTVLHKAALIAKDDAMLKYLIALGAKKDAVTNFKETAYDLASENETLSKNNVSVNFLK